MDSVVHFEIPAADTDRAGKFYEKTFGWMVQPAEHGVSSGYQWVMTTETDKKSQQPVKPGAINGGIFPRTDLLQHPDIMIDVSDIDAALEKVKTGGGKVVREKRAAGDMGWSAYIEDTEGNLVGLWQKATK